MVASQPRSLGIDLGLDIRVILFALGASVVAGLAIAQAPILASRNVKLTDAFGTASATFVRTARRVNSHDLIVTLQIAMALAMLVSAALFVQSLRSFNSVNPGFRADNLLLASLDPRAAGYDAERVEGFWRETLARVSRLPGVETVSLARTVPLAPGRQRQFWLNPSSGQTLELDTNFIGPRYFGTLGIPLVSGRELSEQDGKTSRPVVVVNERFAAMFWPGRDPIGRGIRLPDSGNPIAEVVGVVRDVKYRDLRAETGPMIYRPVFQTRSTDAMTLHVRTAGDPGSMVEPIRLGIQGLNPNVPLFQVTTLEEHLDGSFAQTRQAAVLTSVFGVIALLMSGVGVYGVTALAVSHRTRDLGIRMALGARRRDIIRVIGTRGAVLAMAGLLLGLFGSFGFTQIAGALLFGITNTDVATFVGTAALLMLVCVVACSLPVRAATRLDAVAAIRHE